MMKTDLSKVSALEYAEKFKAVIKSIGATDDNCGNVRCEKCPLYIEDTYDCKGKLSEESMQIIMDYEIPIDWNEVQKRADNGEDVRVLVSDNGMVWDRRYFAKYEDGNLYAYADGLTKWSDNGDNDFIPWEHAKLAEEEQ